MPTSSRFAAKSSSLAPLTRQANSFSPHTYAKPSMSRGKLIVANYQFSNTQRIEGFSPSYSAPPEQEQQPPEEGAV